MKNILILALFVLISCGQSAESAKKAIDPAVAKKEVASAFNNLVDGILTRDEAKLRSVASTDLVWGHTGGEQDDISAFIKTGINKDYNYRTMVPRDQTIRVYDDIAIVRNVIDGIFDENDDQSVKVEIAMVTTWQNQDGKWKLIDRQGAMIEESKIEEDK